MDRESGSGPPGARGTRTLLAGASLLLGVVSAGAMLAYGPKRLVFCQDADALSDFYRWAAEGTVGIVHVDGGAGYYPSCYAPSPLAWWLAVALIIGGLLAGAYVAAKGPFGGRAAGGC